MQLDDAGTGLGAGTWTSAALAPSACGDPRSHAADRDLLPPQRQPGRRRRAEPDEHRHGHARGAAVDPRARRWCCTRPATSDVKVEEARWIAEQIPGARFVELPGARPSPGSATPTRLLDEVEEFLTGVRRGPELDRVLATVLFTDIVGSTATAAAARRPARGASCSSAPRRRPARCWRASRAGGRHRRRRVLRDVRRARRAPSAARWRSATACASSGLEVRAGVHTGEVEIGRRQGRRASPCTSARGSRAQAGPGEVLVSQHGEGPRRRVGAALRGSRDARAQGRARRVAALPCSRGLAARELLADGGHVQRTRTVSSSTSRESSGRIPGSANTRTPSR